MLSLIGIRRGRKSMKSAASGRPRRSVLMRRRRHFLIGIAGVGLALGLAAGTLWLRTAGYVEMAGLQIQNWTNTVIRTTGLTVREIYVVGRNEVDRSAVLRALAIKRGDSMFSVDPASARQRLVALGWIKNAKVYRRFPDIVEVHLEERRPLAIWQRKGRLVLIDRNGVAIIRKGLERFRDLPIVLGKEAPRHAAELVDMLRMQPQLYAKVDAAVRVGDRRWNIKLKNGIEVNLPEKGPKERWNKLAKLVAEHGLFERDIKVIDMRLPDRLVVRMAPTAATKRREPGKDT